MASRALAQRVTELQDLSGIAMTLPIDSILSREERDSLERMFAEHETVEVEPQTAPPAAFLHLSQKIAELLEQYGGQWDNLELQIGHGERSVHIPLVARSSEPGSQGLVLELGTPETYRDTILRN